MPSPSECPAGERPLGPALKETDQERVEGLANALQPGRVGYNLGAVEGRAENRGMADLAAQAAADTAIIDMRHRVGPQGIGARLHRQGRTAGQPDAAMISGAGIRIDAEPFMNDALAGLDRFADLGPLAPLLVQHAFGLGDDDFGTWRGGCQRFLQGLAHLGDVIGASERPDPIDPDPA